MFKRFKLTVKSFRQDNKALKPFKSGLVEKERKERHYRRTVSSGSVVGPASHLQRISI